MGARGAVWHKCLGLTTSRSSRKYLPHVFVITISILRTGMVRCFQSKLMRGIKEEYLYCVCVHCNVIIVFHLYDYTNVSLRWYNLVKFDCKGVWFVTDVLIYLFFFNARPCVVSSLSSVSEVGTICYQIIVLERILQIARIFGKSKSFLA